MQKRSKKETWPTFLLLKANKFWEHGIWNNRKRIFLTELIRSAYKNCFYKQYFGVILCLYRYTAIILFEFRYWIGILEKVCYSIFFIAAPQIKLPNRLLNASVFTRNDRIHFKIPVFGCPRPEMTWWRNGNRIVTGGNIHLDSDSRYAYIEVNHLTRKDAGVYELKAQNDLGSDDVKFALEVNG